ncbi:MAG: hypothetical protein GXO80_14140 [Chlorobi bacterium]|nr:hypothetical protein [Chlorobiota bacterium]
MSGIYKDKKWKDKNGKFVYFFNSGKIKSIENYSNNLKNGKWVQYYENGNKDFEIIYENDKKDGEWLWYFENGQLSAKENYINDKRVDTKFWNEKGIKVDITQAEFPPTFMGGDIKTFYNWAIRLVRYPNEAKENGFQGDEVAKFYIDKQGKTGVVKITKSVHPSIDKEIISIIENSPLWKPGKMHGRFHKYIYELTLTYRLD